MLLASDVVEQLDVSAAILLEASDPPDMLPRSGVDSVCAARVDQFQSWMAGNLRREWTVQTPDVISVRKPNGSSRPVPVLNFQDRVLYRALSQALTPHAESRETRSAAYESMANGPLVDGDWAFVAHADVAAFFQYVDHDVLANELVAQSGEAGLAEALVDILAQIMGRGFGLPQTYHASEPLADVYIDPAERRLIRAGRPTWRYSDDFRLAADTRREAEESVNLLDLELGRLGLTLNDDKTFVLPRSRYQTWLTAAEQQFEQFAVEAQADLLVWSPYTDLEVEPEQAEIWVAAAVSALDRWVQRVAATEHRRLVGAEGLATRKLLGLALDVLSAMGDAAGIRYTGAVLAREPQLTPKVSRYLSIVASDNTRAVQKVIRELLANDEVFLSAWQRIWLNFTLRDAPRLTKALSTWVVEQTRSKHGLLAAHAAWTAARQGLMSAEELLVMSASVSGGSSAPVLEALVEQRDRLTAAQISAIKGMGWIERTVLEYEGLLLR